ncbi:MAG TPA: metallophosphoesterase [Solirubrobacterales bacterium]
MSDGSLLAVSDLHVEHPENREIVSLIEPESDADWLIVCGDVADKPEDVEWALRLLRARFATVVWVPGNHELLAQRVDPPELRGERRYRHLVELCRGLDVITPEDPYPIWDGPGGPVRVAPLFLLYDYSFGSNVGATREEALRRAHEAGVVCVDEFLLDPVPYPSRQAWCEARVRETEVRLTEAEPLLPSVLINHFPLLAEPTRVLRHPEFAQWCGTVRTAEWHRRFRATAVVYGHLHIPRTTWHDGVRFEEVSLGYPRERHHGFGGSLAPRRILPEPRRA